MKWKRWKKIHAALLTVILVMTMSGCDMKKGGKIKNLPIEEQSIPDDEEKSLEQETKTKEAVKPDTEQEITAQREIRKMPEAQEMREWEVYFEERNGTAVFFRPDEQLYRIYNPELSKVRNSPCSTFKIISSLAGLESGTISLEDSERPWNGEIFWNENWNKDMDFPEAFRTSCVWYYRELIDELGPLAIQNILDELQYGNRDISDWEGLLDNPDKNRLLRGFWLESSLKISAVEQVETLKKIFYEDNNFTPDHIRTLTQVMKTEYQTSDGAAVYGKTGMGKRSGVTTDCWFTGFADLPGGRTFFCVYLGETQGQSISTEWARNIALQILGDYDKTEISTNRR